MTFQQLIKSNHWLSVKEVFLSLYTDQHKNISGYEDVFHQLQMIQPAESNIEIVLTEHIDEGLDEGPYTFVSGKEVHNNRGMESESLAIEFVKWNEWLGMTIENNTLKDYTQLEILSHCLYEITFVGFEEEKIQQELKNIEADVEELKNMTDDERKKNTYSLEELLKKLDEPDDKN